MIEINTIETKLDKLIEECAEVIHAASKAKRFGMSNWHPKSKEKNSTRLLEELIDLTSSIEDIKKDIPKPSIAEMADEVLGWYTNTPIRMQQEFESTNFDKLVIYHSTLGRSIRNHFKLWQYNWDKKIVDGIDLSPEHPDTVSMKVIEEVWRRVNNESN